MDYSQNFTIMQPIWIISVGGILTTVGSLFIGPFIGVLLAFWVNEQHRKRLANDRKLFFRNLLLSEIRKSIDLLKEKRVNLIPTDGWNSLVNSGDMALFDDRAVQLSDAFFDIQNYNYEAKRVRDAIEEVYLKPFHTNDSRSSNLKITLDETTDQLLEKLKALDRCLMEI